MSFVLNDWGRSELEAFDLVSRDGNLQLVVSALGNTLDDTRLPVRIDTEPVVDREDLSSRLGDRVG